MSGSVDVARVAREFVLGERELWGASQWAALSDADLLALTRELGDARRRGDAGLAVASAEVARRSSAAAGQDGLARKEGFANPGRLIADVTGGSTGEAGRILKAGDVLLNASAPEPEVPGSSASEASTAPPPPPRFPVLAAALSKGQVSVEAASAVSGCLTRLAEVVDPDALAGIEWELVQKALELPLDRLAAVLRQCEAQWDRETALLREAARRESRYLNFFENRDSVVVVDGRLDVETAAPIRAAVDELVAQAMRSRRDQKGRDPKDADLPVGEGLPVDERTAPQMRADALSQLAKHALSCDSDATGVNTTVVVRIGLNELQSGEGWGQIDGVDQPVSAGTVRRMAADAGIIPLVLGGPSQVLGLGHTQRLFTRGQKLALIERDGGCAWCHAPPSWCEAHHIDWWIRDGGKTDLRNGVMLCTACHHRIHRDNWAIQVREDPVTGVDAVWFTPPVTAGNRQPKPIKGGRQRYEYQQAA